MLNNMDNKVASNVTDYVTPRDDSDSEATASNNVQENIHTITQLTSNRKKINPSGYNIQ